MSNIFITGFVGKCHSILVSFDVLKTRAYSMQLEIKSRIEYVCYEHNYKISGKAKNIGKSLVYLFAMYVCYGAKTSFRNNVTQKLIHIQGLPLKKYLLFTNKTRKIKELK